MKYEVYVVLHTSRVKLDFTRVKSISNQVNFESIQFWWKTWLVKKLSQFQNSRVDPSFHFARVYQTRKLTWFLLFSVKKICQHFLSKYFIILFYYLTNLNFGIYLHLERLNNSISDEKDEFERYLEEKQISSKDSNYSLLKWWKVKFLVYNQLL